LGREEPCKTIDSKRFLAGEEVAAAMLARRGGCGGGRRRGSEKESSQPPPPHLLATHALVELFPFQFSLGGCRLLLPRFLLRLLPSFSRSVSLLFSVYLFP